MAFPGRISSRTKSVYCVVRVNVCECVCVVKVSDENVVCLAMVLDQFEEKRN